MGTEIYKIEVIWQDHTNTYKTYSSLIKLISVLTKDLKSVGKKKCLSIELQNL